MAQKVTNFGRFFSAFRKLTVHGEPEEARRHFVRQYTGGRTDSLKEMSREEYSALCCALEGMNGTREELKKRRSIVLKLMQELEVDTTNWNRINSFCSHPRIAGKPFGQLNIEELKEVATRLRTIKRKGWVRGGAALDTPSSETLSLRSEHSTATDGCLANPEINNGGITRRQTQHPETDTTAGDKQGLRDAKITYQINIITPGINYN